MKNKAFVLLVNTILAICCFDNAFIEAHAEEITAFGYRDEYKADSNYDTKGFVGSTRPSPCNDDESIGELKLNGMIRQSEAVLFGGQEYYVTSGEITFSYDLSKDFVNASDTDWHIVNDDGKKVDDITLSKKIGKGAIIVESSLDKQSWHKDKEITDIINNKGLDSIYTATKIQLSNGCYYRITIAYKVGINTGEKEKVAFWNDKYKYKKYTEQYEFFLSYKDSKSIDPNQQSFELGKTFNTGKDNGFSGKQEMNKKDPHFGWKLGQFKVSGYTDTVNKNGKTVFLKNAGDQVDLSFRLLQDINKLNGNSNLTISRDRNGYDSEFGIKETDMGRGFLIVQITDANNKTSVEKYQNYLEANTTTTADTHVGLYEEGDYKVALDYEIRKKNTIGEDFYNYKIEFDFSVRNGNCMIFPFDVKTNKELNNESYTPNGFRIDWAKSRYLTIEVEYSTLVKGENGLVEDVRYYRPSKDGDAYTEPGIYRLTIINDYLSRPLNKTIYVGDVGYIKALSTTGLSVDELNSMMDNGATVTEKGEIVQPAEEEETFDIIETPETLEMINAETSNLEKEDEKRDDVIDTEHKEGVEDLNNKSIPLVGIAGILIVALIVAVFMALRRKKND